jgi:hypothetical protein
MAKKIIADVFDCVAVDNTDGSTIGTTTLQSANIDVAVSEVEVRAGKGNALQATLHVQRDINIDLTDMQWDMDWIAKQLGTSVVTGAETGYAMPKFYSCVDLDGAEAGTAIGFVLDNTPLSTASGLKIYDEDGVELVVTTDYTISGANVTIVGGVVGDVYEVRTYKYSTPATTQTLTFESDKFSRGMTLVLSTLETDEDESNPNELQYIFPNAIPNGSFQINTSSEKKESPQNLKLKVVKPSTTTVVGKLLRIPLS